MNILITGGAGYIGSIVANYFLEKKHDVTIIDNLSKGYKFLIPKSAIFINSDISNKNKITKIFKWKPKFNNLKRMLEDSVNWEIKLNKKK